MGYYEQNLQRKQEIEDGLLALMKEKSFEQITVKDLTEKLNIARKTFYHYYPNKQACLESLTDRLIYTCNLRVMQESNGTEDVAGIYESRLRYWVAQKDFLDAVIRNKLGSFFLDRVLMYLVQEEKSHQEKLSTSQMQYDEDILFFYMSGQIFLLLKWCHDGFSIPIEEMVRKYLRLLHEPLIKTDRK